MRRLPRSSPPGPAGRNAVICDIDVGSELELAGYRPLLDTRADSSAPSSTAARTPGDSTAVLAGDEDAIEGGTGADFAAVPSGGLPALEDSFRARVLTGA